MTSSPSSFEVIRVTYPEAASVPEPVKQLAKQIQASCARLVDASDQPASIEKSGRYIGTPTATRVRQTKSDATEITVLRGNQGVCLDTQQDNPPGFLFDKLELFDIRDPRACVRARSLDSDLFHEFGRLTFGFRLYTSMEDNLPSWCPLELIIPSGESRIVELSELPEEAVPHIDTASRTVTLLASASS